MLAVIAYIGHITPWTLLTLTFLIGCGVALYGPAWQSSVGEQVPREHIPAAVALNTMSYNLARTAGPAVGGVIVATAGRLAAFVVNALTYVGLIVDARLLEAAEDRVAPAAGKHAHGDERGAALRRGCRRRSAPCCCAGFVLGVLGSAIWALMPLIARDLLGGGALTYGVLFGTFGVGAVVGALMQRGGPPAISRTRRSCGYRRSGSASPPLVAAFSPWLPLTLFAFVLGGASWVLMLSTFNITMQMSSPRWVTGRALAMYQMVVFGGMAIGSWMWGEVAESRGLVGCARAVRRRCCAPRVLLGLTARVAADGESESRAVARRARASRRAWSSGRKAGA